MSGALGLLVLSGCAQYGGAIHGQVWEVLNPEAPYEVWKKVPVSGAFVFVKWNGFAPKRGTKEDGNWTGPNSFEVLLVKDEPPPSERLSLLEMAADTQCGFNGRTIRDVGGAKRAYYAELYEEARQLDLRTLSEKQRREDLLEKFGRALGRQAGSPEGHRRPSSRGQLPITQPPPPPPGHDQPIRRGPYCC